MTGQRLWAPWRMSYIVGRKRDGGCVFCDKPALGDDDAALVVLRGEHCYVILNSFPYNNGHLMVVPFAHVAALDELPEAARAELIELTSASISALRRAYDPEGFNLGINQGVAAGAGIAGHIHQHVVPRWAADTNFMPVIGDARVLPESLGDTRDRVASAFAER